MSLIVAKKTKDMFKLRGLKTSHEAVQVLNAEFEKLCQKTADNVLAQDLKTVKAIHVPRVRWHLEVEE